jgi:8-oxo-dGTP pyrophosphatase MutT (NUDIX family)
VLPDCIDASFYVREPSLPERVSAGGVVVRLEGGGLLVALVRELDDEGRELKGYVLPKGRVDPGETVEETAVREIHEEAGLTEVQKLADLGVSEHQDLKREVWAVCQYGLYFTQQVHSEIVDTQHHFGFGWFPLEALPEMFWPCERDMLERERKRIYELVIARQNPKPRKKGFM